MVKTEQPGQQKQASNVSIVRHKLVRQKLQISSAKLFDMIAKGVFPKPFQIIPGGRAVGWLESDVDMWILDQKRRLKGEANYSHNSTTSGDCVADSAAQSKK
jgi:prophage regulatory protein